MKVKIDTKAHFKVFTIISPGLHANMAEELGAELRQHAAGKPGHLIVVLEPPSRVDEGVLKMLRGFAEQMSAKNLSFVITGILPVGKEIRMLTGDLCIAGTYQEAVDLVMMEEMERELGAEEAPFGEGPEA